MGQKRQRYSREYKLQIVFEAIRGERSTQEIAMSHQIHPDLVVRWKREFLKNEGGGIFISEKTVEQLKNSFAKKEAKLRNKMSDIKKQLSWLKRKMEEALTRDQRLALIETHDCELMPCTQERLLSIELIDPLYRQSSIKEGSFQLLKTGAGFQLES